MITRWMKTMFNSAEAQTKCYLVEYLDHPLHTHGFKRKFNFINNSSDGVGSRWPYLARFAHSNFSVRLDAISPSQLIPSDSSSSGSDGGHKKIEREIPLECNLLRLFADLDSRYTHSGEILCSRRFVNRRTVKHFIRRRLVVDRSGNKKRKKNVHFLFSHKHTHDATMQIVHRPNKWTTRSDAATAISLLRCEPIIINGKYETGRRSAHFINWHYHNNFVMGQWDTRKWHEYCYCDGSVPFVFRVKGHRQYITRAAGVCVYECAETERNRRYFFVSLSLWHSFSVVVDVVRFLLYRIRPPFNCETNGGNVSIARATMTTYGLIILWYHKYVQNIVCAVRVSGARKH